MVHLVKAAVKWKSASWRLETIHVKKIKLHLSCNEKYEEEWENRAKRKLRF
jgi:hypothetical protein